MLRLPRSARVFASSRLVDAGASIDRLVQIVRDEWGQDPFTGNVFCFFSDGRSWVTLLVWDRNGFWCMRKRLERGLYPLLESRAKCVEIGREQLVMLLSGIDPRTSRFRPQFVRDVRMSLRDDDARSTRVTQ